MSAGTVSWVFAVALLLGVFFMVEAGRCIRVRQVARSAGAIGGGFGAVEGAVFALMGLLVAFTFSGAVSRLDSRRALIVQESNDVGTAYLRLDLLPEAVQPPLREKFRQYVDARLETYRLIDRPEEAQLVHGRAVAMQLEIWRDAVAATRGPEQAQARMLLLPALNEMIDVTTTRIAALQTHTPPVIFALLGVLVLASSLLAGYGMGAEKSRSWLHVIGFALLLSLSVFVILDLEYPREGLLRLDDFDRHLLNVRAAMD